MTSKQASICVFCGVLVCCLLGVSGKKLGCSFACAPSTDETYPPSWKMRFASCKISDQGWHRSCMEGFFRCPTNYYGFALALVKKRFLAVSGSDSPRLKSIVFHPVEAGGLRNDAGAFEVPSTEIAKCRFEPANWFAPRESRLVMSMSSDDLRECGVCLEPGQGYAVSVCLEGENPPADWQDAELWVQFIMHRDDEVPDLDFGRSGGTDGFRPHHDGPFQTP